jgi:hypothetical protein
MAERARPHSKIVWQMPADFASTFKSATVARAAQCQGGRAIERRIPAQQPHLMPETN